MIPFRYVPFHSVPFRKKNKKKKKIYFFKKTINSEGKRKDERTSRVKWSGVEWNEMK